MDRTPHIAILLGTARTGRNSEHVAKYILDIVSSDDRADARLYDVRDYMTDRTIPDWQPDGETEQTSAWRAVAKQADAFIMVVPEYNSGYPGEWKLVVDQASKEYVGKPVITVGVSNGPFMGARMTEHIRPILTRLGFVSIHAPLYVGTVKEFIAMDSATRDEQYKDRITKSLNVLLAYEARLYGIQDELVS
jgi:NAD(P)H-dependent FMN reductase